MKLNTKSIFKLNMKKSIILLAVVLIAIIITLSFMMKTKVNTTDAEMLMLKSYAELTEQDTKIANCDYVTFAAFFARDLDGDGNAEKILGNCSNVKTETPLYIDINVLTQGYLKNGTITIESSNFKYSMNMVKDSVLKNNYISNDVDFIELNQVNAGTEKLIIGNVISDIKNNINNYSGVSTVTLNGIFVSNNGQEQEISKTIDLTVDWYGLTKTSLQSKVDTFYFYKSELESETISFTIDSNEVCKELILKENVVTLQIPALNGYEATKVECTSSNVNAEYDEENKILTIKRNSICDETGNVEKALSRYNKYEIEVTYPKEAYEQVDSYVKCTIPVTSYYEGYNNSNGEFTNPYKSQEVKKDTYLVIRDVPTGDIYDFEVEYEGKDYMMRSKDFGISKQWLLDYYDNDGVVENEEFIVKWIASRGSSGEIKGMTMSETKNEDKYGDEWSDIVMEDYISYTGIYFENVEQAIGTSSYISVYDENNNYIDGFRYEELITYTKDNPYMYAKPIKHIEVELPSMNKSSQLVVNNIKEIDVQKLMQDFTKEELKNIDVIYTYLTGVCQLTRTESETVDDIDYAYFVSDKSYSAISLEKSKFSTQETYKNINMNITAKQLQLGDSKWKNGTFLIEFPEEFINLEINDIDIDNKKINIYSYDLYKENGKYFIKILTENEEEGSFTITINANLTLDPRSSTANREIKLYSTNEQCNDYYQLVSDIYDVDSDQIFDELIGMSTCKINLLSPTTLITFETISNYNDSGDITVAPNVADVLKSTRQADIDIKLLNNYPNTVSGITILGKIPFEGNKHILSEELMDSKFTTTMTSEGIIIPEELKDAVVYYSEKDDVNKNIEDTKNGWKLKQDVEDFSKIKSYLIDIKNYTIEIGKEYTFKYRVSIPENIEYNTVSYSNHAVFYELNTDEGNLQLKTEPSKVGIKIARKYNLGLTKYRKNSDTVTVTGAIYSLVGKDLNGNVISNRNLSTDKDGIIKLRDLYVNYEYEIKEINSAKNYELNNTIYTFKVTENEQNELVLESSSDEITLDLQNETVKIKTEDEVKYDLEILKVDLNGKVIKGVVYNLTGENIDITRTTNSQGNAKILELQLDKEYTLTEKEAYGYYLNNPITFKVYRDEQGQLQTTYEGAVITENQKNVVLSITQTNEKLPTYNLEVLKVSKFDNNNNGIQGAKYKLTSDDIEQVKTITTNEEGIACFEELYQYVEGREITGRYTLKEIQPPNGYVSNEEEISFVVSTVDGELNIEIENSSSLTSIKGLTIEENTIKITLQNEPLFRLVKLDSKTKEPISGAKFIIYKETKDLQISGFATDINGYYVGTRDSDGNYIVQTDENGEINLVLPAGYYRAVEVEVPGEYNIQDGRAVTRFIVNGSGLTHTIYYIEDLVELAVRVNSGATYEGIKVELARNLDFLSTSSYRSYASTQYGDLNNDGTIHEIRRELITGDGFTPIGVDENNCFSGIFEGNNYYINNLYANSKEMYAGLFGYLNGAKVYNLNITGTVSALDVYGTVNVGGLAAIIENSEIYNVNNYAKIIIQGQSGSFDMGGISARLEKSKIVNCNNYGEIIQENYSEIDTKISGSIGGIFGDIIDSEISFCTNKGKINIINKAEELNKNSASPRIGGISGYIRDSKVNYCYNEETITINVENFSSTSGIDIGGLVGGANGNNILNSGNKGNIIVTGAIYDMDVCIGGIVGYITDTEVVNNFNWGNIECQFTHSTVDADKPMGTITTIGPVNVKNCYNMGNYSIENTSYSSIIAGGIAGIINSNKEIIEASGNYSLQDSLGVIGKVNDINLDEEDLYEEVSEEVFKSQEFVDILNEGLEGISDTVEWILDGEYAVLEEVEVPSVEVEESIVENTDITVENDELTDNLLIRKYSEDGKIRLEGAKFEVSAEKDISYLVGEVKSNYTYKFVKNSSGYYVSNNANKSGSIARSYFPIDLTGETGTVKLTLTTYISSQSGYDIGYAAINTSSTTIPSYNASTNILSTSGTKTQTTTKELEGGKMYYLHVGYRKNGSTNTGSDAFTIRKIALTKGFSEVVTSDYRGYADLRVPENIEITVREIQAPVGYELNDEVKTIKVQKNGIEQLNFYNKKAEVNYTINKVDEETNEPIPGTEFIIYSLNANNKILDFAKEKSGRYVGEMNSSGKYVVKTDENGQINLSVLPGKYMAIEVSAAEGYILSTNQEEKTIYFEVSSKIEYIEDLVQLSEDVNSGKLKEGYVVTLARTLDFNNDNSYKNPNDTSFGDYNGDGTVEGIKTELTKTSGCGFKTIGKSQGLPFKGIFDGNGYEIKNIFINTYISSTTQYYAGLFGYITDAQILNLSIGSGTIKSSSVAGGFVAGNATNSIIANCSNYANITSTGAPTGGIVSLNLSNSTIINCYNAGDVTGLYAGGILGNYVESTSRIINCFNVGQITGSSSHGGIVGYGGVLTGIKNCYYLIGSATAGTPTASNDAVGVMEAKSAKEMYSYDFVELLNNNIENIHFNIELRPWMGGFLEESDSASDEIKISSIEDLVSISVNSNSGETYSGQTIKLIKSLDFNADESYENPNNTSFGDYNGDGTTEGIKAELTKTSGRGFIPIGYNSNYPFKGIFDGNGYEIANLYMNQSSGSNYLGLFGFITDAKILNLTIKSGTITSNFIAGGFVGGNATNSIIANCINNVDVISSIPAGGFVGNQLANTTIINCYNAGDVTGIYAGGIVGNIVDSNSKIINCFNTGLMTGSAYSGGILGYNTNVSILQNCYYLDTSAPAGTRDTSLDAEGVVESKTESEIKSSEFLSILNNYIGYLNNNSLDIDVKLVYWTGPFADDIYVPLSFTHNEEYICSVEDLVQFSQNVRSGNSYTGITVYLERDLDFNNSNSYKNPNDTSYGDYNGDGTVEGIKAELTNAAGSGFKPIGTSSNVFKGVFDGQRNTINNLYINKKGDYIGLFYSIENAQILNLTLGSGKIITNYPAGGIVGQTAKNSVIANCITNVNINTNNNAPAAGIVGLTLSGTTIVNCYNTGTIIGSQAGGILGGGITDSNSKIINCYNIGSLVGKSATGGIIGSGPATPGVKYCYYLNTTASKGSQSPDQAGVIESKTAEEFSSYSMAVTLNNNIKKITTDIELFGWTSDGISPVFISSHPIFVDRSLSDMFEVEEVIVASTLTNKKLATEESSYNFVINKKDEETNEPLANVKFVVLDSTGNFAKNYQGEYVGEKTTINGEDAYILTTNENGQIFLNLNVGTYKLVEIETLEEYLLGQEQEFEITAKATQTTVEMISTYYPDKDYIIQTSDGGVMQTNYGTDKTIAATNTAEGVEIVIDSTKGYIAKYNNDGKVEKVLQITGFITGNAICEDEDGNYVIIGEATQVEIPAEDTVDGNAITLSYSETTNRTVILKLDSNLKVIWAIPINGINNGGGTSRQLIKEFDDSYVMQIRSSMRNLSIPAEYTVDNVQITDTTTGNILLECTKDGKIVRAKAVNTQINNIMKKSDGGYIGTNGSTIFEVDEEFNGETTTTLSLTSININSTYPTNDGGVIAAGYLNANTVISGEYVENKKDITLSTAENKAFLIIKYNKDYKIEWITSNRFYEQYAGSCGTIRQDVNGNYIFTLYGPTYKIVRMDQVGNILDIIDAQGSAYPCYFNNTNTGILIQKQNTTFINHQFDTQIIKDEITVFNEKAGFVNVHHYLQGTGPEYGNEAVEVIESERLKGKIGTEYITAPATYLINYKLITDENGEYITPENGNGNFQKQEQDVYYYYVYKPINLVVHHYLEGTETSLIDDEIHTYSKGDSYQVSANEELLESYDLVEVVGEEQAQITENAEIIYYYRIREYNIITTVEYYDEENENKGGTISGEEEEPYETVEHGSTSTEEIIMTPFMGYRLRSVRVLSTTSTSQSEDIIYGENANEDSEVSVEYDLNSNNVMLTQFENITTDKEVIVNYEPNEGTVIVYHYVENSTEPIYPNQIYKNSVGEIVETEPVKVENYVVVGEPADRNATVTEQTQEKVYYYQRQYNITTGIIEYKEPNEQGTMEPVVGGTISGQDEEIYEKVLKGRNSQNEIVITPAEDFEIVKITINDEEYDFAELVNTDGSVILEKEFFKNMEEDKDVQVEFRRKAQVIVKYLEVDTNNVVAEEEIIEGYVGKAFETSRKNVPNYKTASIDVTNENNEAIETKGNMTIDDITIIYWYEKVPSGLIVKHVEKVTYKVTEEGTGEEIQITSILLKEEEINGFAGETIVTSRKEFENYVPSENEPVEGSISVSKVENSKEIILSEEVQEVIYWYEREFKITTEVEEHEQLDDNGNLIKVKGGTITGEELDVVEKVLRGQESVTEITAVPDSGYRVQKLIINNIEYAFENLLDEAGSLKLKQFTNVQEDKTIKVVFERIPAKVVVEYLDKDTGENIIENKVVDGFVNSTYEELRSEIENYIPAEPEPENNVGIMTEETIVIQYFYTKQFKITTDVIEHEEENKNGEVIKVKGGTISGEELEYLEKVTRGEDSTKEIIITPDENYRISKLKINDKEYHFKELLNDDGSLKLNIFENMQEDKHVQVEFEKIPAKLIIQYREDETGEEIAKQEIIQGFVNDSYKAQAKEIDGYEIIVEKLPENAEGKMTEEDITIIFLYKKVVEPEEDNNEEIPEIGPEDDIKPEPDTNKDNNLEFDENINKTSDAIGLLVMLIIIVIIGLVLTTREKIENKK